MQALLSGTSSFSGADIANKRSHLVPQKTVSRAIWSSGIGAMNRHRIVSSPEMRYPESAMSELIFIVFCSTSKMTAVDHPNIRAPFIAVMGPSSFQSSTGITSP
jgi:hypothetical protein